MVGITRVAAALGLIWLFYDAVIPGWSRPSTDFPNYYTAARLVRTGQPLWHYYDWTWFQREMNFAGIEHQLGGYIPQTPLTMMPFVPLSYLRPLAARRVWLILNLAFLALTLWLLARMTRFGVASLFLLSLLSYLGLRANLVLGQYYLFLLAMLTLAAWRLLRHRDVAGGSLLAGALALKLYGAPLFLLFAVKRRWPAALSMAGAFALVTGCAIAAFGWHNTSYFAMYVLPRALVGETINPYYPSNGTAATLLRRLLVAEAELNPAPLLDSPRTFHFLLTAFTLAILLIPALAASYSVRRDISKRSLAWWLIAMLLASPNTASYTFALLILPMAFLFDELPRRAWVWLGACNILLTPPLWPAWSRLFPRVVILLFLFLVAGWPEMKQIPARHAAWATLGVLILAAAAAFHQPAAPHLTPAVFEVGALYSASPAVSRDGIVYESIAPGRYVLRKGAATFFVDGEAFHPATPDSGAPIYFEAVSGGASRILRLNTRTGTQETVPFGVPNPREPAVSRDGRSIAATSGSQLYVSDERGTKHIPTRAPVHDPSFFPDGHAIVFATCCGIGMAALDSGVESTILAGSGDYARPSVSPDGSHLLFTARRGATWQVWMADLSGGPPTRLTVGDCNNYSPAWELTSREIVFSSDCRRGLGLPALFRQTLQ